MSLMHRIVAASPHDVISLTIIERGVIRQDGIMITQIYVKRNFSAFLCYSIEENILDHIQCCVSSILSVQWDTCFPPMCPQHLRVHRGLEGTGVEEGALLCAWSSAVFAEPLVLNSSSH